MSGAARLAAQAKVNLWLRILAREANGYHQLETLFCRIALADDITVRLTPTERSLDCAGPAMPADGLGPVETNLAYRAAVAYASARGWRGGFAIEITKRIPVGGGLGGGSADAGGVLRAFAALDPQPLGEDQVLVIASELGADVAFLTAGHAMALAWGRGERMLGLRALPARAVRLMVPGVSVSTADAYGWLDAARAREAPSHQATVIDPATLVTWRDVAAQSENHFEPVVAAHVPDVRALLAQAGGGDVLFTRLAGSGSAVFQLIDRAPTVEERAPSGHATTDACMTSTVDRVADVQLIG